MVAITSGDILIADPFLKDPNFMRSVVFLCEHLPEGSVGFVLNKGYEQVLSDVIAEAEGCNMPLYYGGPVQMDTIHFLHKRPDLIPGGTEVINGIFWGGDFDEVIQLIQQDQLSETDIRFFLGYSGWSEGQLEEELKSKSWITRNATKRLIFPDKVEQLWKEALSSLGGEYQQMVNYPIDPQLN
jgi:putative transcriptional regulator